MRPVKGSDAIQTTENIGNMRTEHAAVRMRLINDNIFQIGKKISPIGMMRQNPRMEHIGVGKEDAGVLTDGSAVGGSCVAIVDGGIHLGKGSLQGNQAGELVLGEGFGGEEKEGARLRL